MPNFSKDEQKVLFGDELELATRTRSPKVRELSDTALSDVISRLSELRDTQATSETGASASETQRMTFLRAALRSDPAEAGDSAEALAAIGGAPWGPWLLAGVALGLVAFGAYAGMQARYRRMDLERPVAAMSSGTTRSLNN